MTQPLLEVSGLSVRFNNERGAIQPVNDVSFSIFPGQTLAVVGESGSGKSVSALSILRLIPEPPGKIIGGRVMFGDCALLIDTIFAAEVRALSPAQYEALREETTGLYDTRPEREDVWVGTLRAS